MIKLNEAHEFLLAIESFGNVMSTIELSTENYVLLNTQVSKMQHKIFRSVTRKQLKRILLKMRFGSFEIPHEKMFIAIFSETLTAVSRQSMKLLITCHNLNQEQKIIFHMSFYNFLVYANENYCSPSVHLSSCENPRTPREVEIGDSIVFKPTIQRSCGQNSNLSYRWSIEDFLHQKTMKNLPAERASFLKLSPFTLSFNDEDFFSGFYSIKLMTFEDDYDNRRHGFNIWRVSQS